jgi:Ras-related protein Rab-5C
MNLSPRTKIYVFIRGEPSLLTPIVLLSYRAICPMKTGGENALNRVVMLGEASVGKSSIVTRILTGEFDPQPSPTVGVGVRPITWKVDGTEYKFHLWDTAGQEVYRAIVPIYFQGAVMALVFLSMDSKLSFERVDDWIGMLKERAGRDVVVIIVANKIDLPVESRGVDEEAVRAWAISAGDYPVFFTSALDGRGVTELFDYVAMNIPIRKNNAAPGKVVLRDGQKKKEEQNCC